MKILFFGDLIGKTGIRGLKHYLSEYQKDSEVDFIFINGENLAGGRGLDEDSYYQGKALGVDGFTLGNHTFDKRDVLKLLRETPSIIRPLNYPPGIPGKGYHIFKKKGEAVAVVSLCGRTFMKPLDCPFKRIEAVLNEINKETKNIIVDIHGEATAEKKALAYFLDGRVTAVLGTHTHTQTNDLQLLNKGTLFLTDLGMVGARDSILGCKKDTIINHFMTGMPFRVEVEVNGPIQVNGVEITLDVNGSIDSFQLVNVLV